MVADKIKVEVVLAFPTVQKIIEVEVPPACSIREAIQYSDIFVAFDEASTAIRNLENGVGIFGKEIKDIDGYVLQEGDRIEIYRPLLLDPRQIRMKRAKKSSQEKAD